MLNKILSGVKTVAIGGHVRPDGDCVGSCMGLYQYIRDNYKEIETDVYLEQIPKVFAFIEATKDIRHEADTEKIYDLFICLDCGDADRLGFSGAIFARAKNTFCVDHHISNTAFAKENYIFPDASSTSELVFDLLEKEKIKKGTAEALYVGMVHDTGVFQYSCTSPSTMRAAAFLMEKGIDGSKIIEETFYEKTYVQNQILGRALLESILFMDGRCIVSAVTKAEMEFYRVDTRDLEGIVSHLRMTKGVEVAIFMYELESHVFKISMRSKGSVDVSKIAQYFSGGGHKKAAGFTMRGNMHDVVNNIARQIELQLDGE